LCAALAAALNCVIQAICDDITYSLHMRHSRRSSAISVHSPAIVARRKEGYQGPPTGKNFRYGQPEKIVSGHAWSSTKRINLPRAKSADGCGPSEHRAEPGAEKIGISKRANWAGLELGCNP